MKATIAFGLISQNRKKSAVIGPRCPNANVRFGSQAALHYDNTRTAAFGQKRNANIGAKLLMTMVFFTSSLLCL